MGQNPFIVPQTLPRPGITDGRQTLSLEILYRSPRAPRKFGTPPSSSGGAEVCLELLLLCLHGLLGYQLALISRLHLVEWCTNIDNKYLHRAMNNN